MNDKLASFANKDVMASRKSSCKPLSEHLVMISKRKENNSFVMGISLHERAVKKLGWVVGDLIRLSITQEGAIVLDRNNKDGRMLAAGSKSKRFRLRFSIIQGVYDAFENGHGNEVEIENGRIAFCIEGSKDA